MRINPNDVEQIAERWDAEAWAAHWQAFGLQWMTQAQEDIAVLVERVRYLESLLPSQLAG